MLFEVPVKEVIYYMSCFPFVSRLLEAEYPMPPIERIVKRLGVTQPPPPNERSSEV